MRSLGSGPTFDGVCLMSLQCGSRVIDGSDR